MYCALQQEFQSDKAAKLKSDQVEIPKGGATEAKKKKEDEEIIFKKDDKKTAKRRAERTEDSNSRGCKSRNTSSSRRERNYKR